VNAHLFLYELELYELKPMSSRISAGRWVLHLDHGCVLRLGRAAHPADAGPGGPCWSAASVRALWWAGAQLRGAGGTGARSAMPMGAGPPAGAGRRGVCRRGWRLYRVVSERVFGVLARGGRHGRADLRRRGVRRAGRPGRAHRSRPSSGPPSSCAPRSRRPTGLTASVGAGSGKQLAKIASTMAKPGRRAGGRARH